MNLSMVPLLLIQFFHLTFQFHENEMLPNFQALYQAVARIEVNK